MITTSPLNQQKFCLNTNPFSDSFQCGLKSVSRQIFPLLNYCPVKNPLTLFFNLAQDSMEKVFAFLQTQSREIEKMRESGKPANQDWKIFGEGISKTVYTHPKIAGHIIKIEKRESVSNPLEAVLIEAHNSILKRKGSVPDCETEKRDTNLEKHVRNLGVAGSIIEKKKYKHLVVPKTALFKNSNNPSSPLIGVEEQFTIIPYDEVPDDHEKQAAEKEFKEFINESGFCDITLTNNHNCGFLNKEGKIIGLFDFDCRIDLAAVGKTDLASFFKDLAPLFFSPKEQVQRECLSLNDC